MHPGPHIRKIASGICAAALACAAAGASAQAVFKQVDLAGRITYTDQPESTASAQTAESAEPEVTKAPRRIANISPRRVTMVVDANEAARRLAWAQQQRKQGLQPLPGEQTRAEGTIALNYRYWRRQEKLRVLVEQAQRRLNETSRVQLAQR